MQNNFNNGSFYQPPMSSKQLEQMAYYEQKRKKEKSELIRIGMLIGIAILAYVIIQTAIAEIFLKGELRELYKTNSIFSNCFSMIASHFCSVLLPFGLMALILRKKYKTPLIPSEKLPKAVCFSWVSVGVCLCVIANFAVSALMLLCEQFGYKLVQGETVQPNSILACVITLFATAIVPPVIEEFAMRCCTLGVLKNYGKGFGVFTVSVVFGLLHGNVIQFVFGFLIGLVLGYVTIKTNNILPAILIHAANNGISVVQSVAQFASGKEEIATTAIAICYYAWLILGAIGFLYLLFKKELLPKKQEKVPKEPYALSLGTKLACLIPGFILPFLMLIAITITTIQKI